MMEWWHQEEEEANTFSLAVLIRPVCLLKFDTAGSSTLTVNGGAPVSLLYSFLVHP